MTHEVYALVWIFFAGFGVMCLVGGYETISERRYKARQAAKISARPGLQMRKELDAAYNQFNNASSKTINDSVYNVNDFIYNILISEREINKAIIKAKGVKSNV